MGIERNRRSWFWWALAVEAALAVGAYGLGWLWGFLPRWYTPYALLPLGVWLSMGLGVVATLPLVVLFLVLERSSWPPLVRIRDIVVQVSHELCGDRPWWQVGLLALAAGVGEEVLFRGWLQNWVAHWLSQWWHNESIGFMAAVGLTALLFGAFHAVTPLYFLLAAFMGVYCGILFLTGGHLAAAVVCHAAYDFFALLWLTRRTTPLHRSTVNARVSQPPDGSELDAAQ